MSRCFPFPPIGYERKHKPEDLALLEEVKRKEKKRKREKKDKERSKDEEKDGSERHKNKKDRKRHKDKKEKHRDKKKDNDDRGKDKEKSSISEESTIAGKLEERSEETLHCKRHSKDSSVEDEGKCSPFFLGQNGGKPFQSILPSQVSEEARFVQELGRYVADDEKSRSESPQRVEIMDKRDQVAAPGIVFRNPSPELAEGKSNDGHKSVHIKKLEVQGFDGEFTERATVQNLTRVVQSKYEGVSRLVEEQNDWRLEDKEKYKETGDDKWREKKRERDKKSHEKDRDKEKEKKKEDKAKVENKKSEHEKLKNAGKDDLGDTRSRNLLKDIDSTALTGGKTKKREDMHTNGFLHGSEIRPNKVQRLALHQSSKNGRKLEASRTSGESSFDKHAVLNNVWLSHQDRLKNGVIESQKPSPSKPYPSATNVFSDKIVVAPKAPHPYFSHESETFTVPKMKDHIAEEAPKRYPHPDSKYLSQIFTVPEVVHWSENDNQEWLFSKKDPPNKPNLESAGVKEELLVWSEAVHIESADVYALPYVIPY